MVYRSHKDLMKEAAPHYKKARKFYDGLAAQLVQQGHALDVFACSLDQVKHLPYGAQACCLHSCSCFQHQDSKLLEGLCNRVDNSHPWHASTDLVPLPHYT